jgi:hypothetical protein
VINPALYDAVPYDAENTRPLAQLPAITIAENLGMQYASDPVVIAVMVGGVAQKASEPARQSAALNERPSGPIRCS